MVLPSLLQKDLTMSVLSTLPAGTFNIDPSHSRVGFSARHAMVTKVRGAFNEYTGSATTSITGSVTTSTTGAATVAETAVGFFLRFSATTPNPNTTTTSARIRRSTASAIQASAARESSVLAQTVLMRLR